MGRPTLLTPESAAKILEAARGGAMRRECAAAGGISNTTLGEWLQRGHGEHPDRDDPEGLYAAFAAEFEIAWAEGTRSLWGIVQKGARGELVERTTVKRTVSGSNERGGYGEEVEETRERTLADSQAARWMLTRRDPTIFSDQMKHEHSGTIGVHTVVEVHDGGRPLSFKAEQDPDDPEDVDDKENGNA